MSKRAIVTALALIMMLSLAGCNGGKDGSSTEQPSDTDTSLTADDILGDKGEDTSQTGDVSDLLGDGVEGDSDKSGYSEDGSIDNGEELDIADTSGISDVLSITTINCGRADCTLIKLGDTSVLIDAGSKDSIKQVQKVLDNKGVKDIDTIIITHSHPEHYGGVSSIIDNYNVKGIMMTQHGDISNEYDELLNSITANNIRVTKAQVGTSYGKGELKVDIIGPVINYEEIDENSAVALVSYKDFSMLFTGGAGMIAEKDYVKSAGDIEVFMAGKHGGDEATSDNLLEKTSPDICIISCESNRDIGADVLSKLDASGIKTYRTDIDGTITIKTDGKEYTIQANGDESRYITDENKETTDSKTENDGESTENDGEGTENLGENNTEGKEDNQTKIVYVSPTSKFYHSSENCSKLLIAREIEEVTMNDAVKQGKEQCSKCW